MNVEELEREWRISVYDKGSEIDPSDERDWYSMAIGWLLAKGVQPDEAYKIAVDWRYNKQIA